MQVIFDLYKAAYMPAIGVHGEPHLGVRRSPPEFDGSLPALRPVSAKPHFGAIRGFIARLARETTAACLWRHGQDAQL